MGGGFEGETVDDVADAAEGGIFVARAGVEVDAYAGEGAREGFGGYAEAIGELGELVEFDGVLWFGSVSW